MRCYVKGKFTTEYMKCNILCFGTLKKIMLDSIQQVPKSFVELDKPLNQQDEDFQKMNIVCMGIKIPTSLKSEKL
jgi:hypothetical protein